MPDERKRIETRALTFSRYIRRELRPCRGLKSKTGVANNVSSESRVRQTYTRFGYKNGFNVIINLFYFFILIVNVIVLNELKVYFTIISREKISKRDRTRVSFRESRVGHP